MPSSQIASRLGNSWLTITTVTPSPSRSSTISSSSRADETGVQPRRGLVEEKDVRLQCQRARQADPFAHAATEIGRHGIAAFIEPHERQFHIHQCGNLRRAETT